MVIHNQHLGMVMQWEDRFHDVVRAHTYLGCIDDPEAAGKGMGVMEHYYPDFIKIAEGYDIAGRTISHKHEMAGAIDEMLGSEGPYVLDVLTPYKEHVLPMIPSGKTVSEIIRS